MHHTVDMFFDSNRRTKCMKQIVNNFPKSVEKFGGIVEKMNMLVFFDIQQKSCIYAVN